MGQHNSNFELASEARQAAERFDECEIKVIKETFKDLCHLKGGSARIDKETFLQYFPLPGLLGERLFAVFDKKCSGEIDYEEFVCGLAVTCRGSWEEKVEFIFNIYDVHQQGAVNRDELAALLNHVPKSIMRFGRAASLDGTNHHHHQHQRNDGQQRRSTAPVRHSPPSSTGTAPAVSRGDGFDRCSPDRSSSGTGVSVGATAIGGGVGLAGDVAAGVTAAAPLSRDSSDDNLATATAPEAAEIEGKDNAPLTSGNLMQLHLASLSQSQSGEESTTSPAAAVAGATAGAVGASPPAPMPGSSSVEEAGSGGGGSSGEVSGDSERSSPVGPLSLSPTGPLAASSPSAGGEAAPPSCSAVIEAATAGTTANGSGGGGGSGVCGYEGGSADSCGDCGACAAAHGAGGLPMTSNASTGGDTEIIHTVSGGGGGGAVSPSGDEVGTAGGATESERGVGDNRLSRKGADRGRRGGSRGNGALFAPGEKGSSRGAGREGAGRGSNTLHSDASTDDGTSAAAPEHPYHAHWEEFTNNDIVDQAFEDCDLNHNGKLSFNEFRLWVERNPMVTQFLQSVFPYDEHREWGDDRKHLPFIHNREFTGSPLMSETGRGGVDAESEDETRRLLIKARNTTRDPALREGIDRLIEQATAGADVSSSGEGFPVGSADGDGGRHQGGETGRDRRKYRALGAGSGWEGNPIGLDLLNELSPRSAKVLQHQSVAKQGFLWKQGHRLKTWKQRWYVVVGNCIYYYQHENDVYPCGVMFLTGSFVEPLQDGPTEKKGYWGIEIARNNEQNHRRRLYTRSKTEQLKWVKELRKASAVVPIEDDFEIGEELGQGRFSRVCMCVNKHTLERKAVKIIMKEDMGAEEKDLLTAEIAIMKLVNHPNIIRMEAVYESKKDIFIVMELHSGGELFDRIVGRPRFTEDEAFTVIHPLVESVAYLHEMGIVHRDLKPENILCGSRIGDIKIADFGLSKMVMPDEIMKMPCGTLTYVAPEVLTLNGYGKEADIWSVGTIMYLLMRGRLPFDGETREEIIENTIHATLAWQTDHVWAGFSDDGKDLVLGMLNKDVSKRYTAKDVLRHPWITQRIRRQEENPEHFEF